MVVDAGTVEGRKDESRRARKYENTKGAGISEGGMGEETWRSGARRGRRPAPNKEGIGVRGWRVNHG